MEAKAVTRYVRVSVRKAKPLLDIIRGQKAEKAITDLAFSAKKAAKIIEKTLKSAIANLKSKEEKSADKEIYIKEAYATEGPILRRFIPRAHGRATRIRKRTSHIYITVASREGAPSDGGTKEKVKKQNRNKKK
ncbi:MAG: 50S ribosomal protein L22 [bacterium]|nr:50S ribosomal protein L22 [bacterium]